MQCWPHQGVRAAGMATNTEDSSSGPSRAEATAEASHAATAAGHATKAQQYRCQLQKRHSRRNSVASAASGASAAGAARSWAGVITWAGCAAAATPDSWCGICRLGETIACGIQQAAPGLPDAAQAGQQQQHGASRRPVAGPAGRGKQ